MHLSIHPSIHPFLYHYPPINLAQSFFHSSMCYPSTSVQFSLIIPFSTTLCMYNPPSSIHPPVPPDYIFPTYHPSIHFCTHQSMRLFSLFTSFSIGLSTHYLSIIPPSIYACINPSLHSPNFLILQLCVILSISKALHTSIQIRCSPISPSFYPTMYPSTHYLSMHLFIHPVLLILPFSITLCMH